MYQILLFVAIGLGLCSAQRSKTDCHLKQIDKCLDGVEKYSQNPSSADLLKTAAGLQEICKSSLDSGNCIKQFMKKCSTPTHRELYSYFHDRFVQKMTEFCNDGPHRQAFLSETPCIVDRVLKQGQYREKCVHSYLATLDRVKADDDPSLKLNTVCCSHNRWTNCMYTLINKECGGDAKKRFETFIRDNLGSTGTQMCNNVSFKFSSKKCQRLYAPAGTKPKGNSSQNPLGKYILSYMGFLLQ